MSSHLGVGLDGGNLLGFLSAVGSFVALDRACRGQSVKMAWVQHAGAWRPVWELLGDVTQEGIVDTLYTELYGHPNPPGLGLLGPDLAVSPERFEGFVRQAALAARPAERRDVDFAMAYGSEVTTDRGNIQDTALRTMSGAGHQHFLGSMAELGRITTKQDIASALFRPWEYLDERPSMRWDPIDDRRHAYRADDPAKSSGHPIRTVRGANRLAVEALPLFPTAAQGRRLVTTGFLRMDPERRGEHTRWLMRWPIWRVPLPLSVVRSLLTHPAVVADRVDGTKLIAMGVAEVLEAERLTEGQFRNFTPAKALIGGRAAALKTADQA